MQQSNKKGTVLQRCWFGSFFSPKILQYLQKDAYFFFLTAFSELFTHSQSVIVQKHYSEIGFKIHPPPLHSTQKNMLVETLDF